MCRDDDKYIEECLSEDMNYNVVRIFNVKPTDEWPPTNTYFGVGGYHLMRIPFITKEKTQDLHTDKQMPG